MRALVIAPQPFFSCRGTPLSVYYRTLIMAELGVQIDLLTYGEGEDVDIPGVNIIRIPRFKRLGSVKVGPSVLKLFLDVFMVFWTVGLLCRRRYHFVHAHEEAVFFCWLLKPLFRFQLVYDMHSSLPEQLSNFNFTQSKWLIGLFAWLEQRCLQAAEVTITICPSLDNYAQRLANPNSLVMLIENSIFEDVRFANAFAESRSVRLARQTERNFLQKHFNQHQEMPKRSLVYPLELGDRLVKEQVAERQIAKRQIAKKQIAEKQLVVYAGTLETYQGIDILVRGFSQAALENRSLFLLVVGGTPAQIKQYLRLVEQCGVRDRVQFTGRVSPSMAKYYVSLAAVQVSPRISGTNTPLKIYEQIAQSIPLVATNIYSHTQVIDDTVAFLVEPTPAGMAGGILEATRSPNAPATNKVKNARRLYEQRYSRRIYKDKMRVVLEQLGAIPSQLETLTDRANPARLVGATAVLKSSLGPDLKSSLGLKQGIED